MILRIQEMSHFPILLNHIKYSLTILRAFCFPRFLRSPNSVIASAPLPALGNRRTSNFVQYKSVRKTEDSAILQALCACGCHTLGFNGWF